jgi:hypothetical protein
LANRKGWWLIPLGENSHRKEKKQQQGKATHFSENDEDWMMGKCCVVIITHKPPFGPGRQGKQIDDRPWGVL